MHLENTKTSLWENNALNDSNLIKKCKSEIDNLVSYVSNPDKIV